jgi:hypothetical protein
MGLAWADAKHDICLQAAGAERREWLVLEHRPEAIDAWGQTLRPRFHGAPVAVGRERHQGPIVSALRQDDCLVLFPVPPFPRATYRDALPPSRANDAPTDAALQGARLLPHRDPLTPLTPQSPTLRAFAHLVEHRPRLGGATVRDTKRWPRARKNDFPHVLQWCQDNDPGRFGDFLSRWPTLKAAPRARRPTLAPCFRAHPGRSADVIKTRMEAIQRAVALTTDGGGITPNALVGPALVAPLRVTLPAITDFDNALADHAQGHPDLPVCDALPGAGAVLAPRRLVAFGAQRERYAAAEDLHKYAGIAPVTERSGKKAWVHWRLQGPQCLRPTCVEGAAASLRPSCWAHAYSQQPRDQGKAPQAAVRA